MRIVFLKMITKILKMLAYKKLYKKIYIKEYYKKQRNRFTFLNACARGWLFFEVVEGGTYAFAGYIKISLRILKLCSVFLLAALGGFFSCFLYSDGETPVSCLKCRWKLLTLGYPHSSAISRTERFVFLSI